MNEYRVFTLKMTTYLTERGFRYIKVVQDVKKPNYLNWIYEATPELMNAVAAYLRGDAK